MAIKGLGNTASHEGYVQPNDLLDTMDIIEHALTEMLQKRSQRIAALVRRMGVLHHGATDSLR
jgi:hypothetical protein